MWGMGQEVAMVMDRGWLSCKKSTLAGWGCARGEQGRGGDPAGRPLH